MSHDSLASADDEKLFHWTVIDEFPMLTLMLVPPSGIIAPLCELIKRFFIFSIEAERKEMKNALKCAACD